LQNASDYYPEVQQWHREAERELSQKHPPQSGDLMAIEAAHP
jgi:hypothetical protein